MALQNLRLTGYRERDGGLPDHKQVYTRFVWLADTAADLGTEPLGGEHDMAFVLDEKVWYVRDSAGVWTTAPTGGVDQFGAVTPGNLVVWNADGIIEDGGAVPTGAGTPSASVASLDGSSAAGSSTDYSRGDHKHADANRPATGEKAALAGTAGTPGSGNTFVTDADSRNTNARTPTAHATSHHNGGTDPVDVTTLSGFPGGTTTFLRADGSFATPPDPSDALTVAWLGL